MLQNLKLPKLPIVLAGLAAYAYYRYSRMSQEEKDTMVSGLKEKGQKLYDDYVPENLKSMFAAKSPMNAGAASQGDAYNSQ